MKAATIPFGNHNQFLRRMRRRYLFHPWLYLMTGISILCSMVPLFAMTAWLLRDRGWAVASSIFNGFWLFGTIVTIAMSWAGYKAGRKPGSRAQPIYWILTLAGAGLGASSLLFARTDLAVASLYGLGALAQVASVDKEQKTSRKPFLLAAANLALVAAMAAKSVAAVTLVFAIRMIVEFAPALFRYGLLVRMRPSDLITGKMSRAKYVNKAMEGCAVGGG